MIRVMSNSSITRIKEMFVILLGFDYQSDIICICGRDINNFDNFHRHYSLVNSGQ